MIHCITFNSKELSMTYNEFDHSLETQLIIQFKQGRPLPNLSKNNCYYVYYNNRLYHVVNVKHDSNLLILTLGNSFIVDKELSGKNTIGSNQYNKFGFLYIPISEFKLIQIAPGLLVSNKGGQA